MTDPSGVLAAFVNLDQEQLRTLDDDGSYGASDDIADMSAQTQMQQQNEMTREQCAGPVSTEETNATFANEEEATASAAAAQNTQDNTTHNNGSRRARIKNAFFSKLKTKRLLPKRQQRHELREEHDEEDIETPYVAIQDNIAAPTLPVSQMSTINYVTTEENAQVEPDCDLLDPPKLSSELFNWYINRSWKKKLLTLLFVITSAFVLYDILFCQGWRIQAVVDRFLDWMRIHPVLGVYGYIGILSLTSLVYIPPSPLIISSGFVFGSIYGPFSGPAIALISSYVGAVIGGSIGFVRTNYMARDLILILMKRYPLLRAIDAAVVRNSLRVMILLRLNPFIPFGVLNYLFGISGVSCASFVLGIVGVIPWHVWLISVGASANSLVYDVENAAVFRVTLVGMGTAFGVIGLVITWKFAKKELQKEINLHEAVNDYRIKDPNLSPQRTKRRTNNEIEEADLEFSEYVKMQFLGIKIQDEVETESEEYRSKLDWELRILDDFS